MKNKFQFKPLRTIKVLSLVKGIIMIFKLNLNILTSLFNLNGSKKIKV